MHSEMHSLRVCALVSVMLHVLVVADGCRRHDEEEAAGQGEAGTAPAVEAQSTAVDKEIPRFAANSPFVRDYNLPGEKEEKRLWERSPVHRLQRGFDIGLSGIDGQPYRPPHPVSDLHFPNPYR